MIEVPLTKGYIALIDDQDSWITQYKWHVHIGRYGTPYAMTWVKGKNLSMHRLLLDFPTSEIDHINSNGLDNQRHNLRLATHTNNCRNRKIQSNNSSGFKGIFWDNAKKRWRAELYSQGKGYRSKRFRDPRDAANAYDWLAIKHFGPFAKTNRMLGLH